jgi:hypothetical protein
VFFYVMGNKCGLTNVSFAQSKKQLMDKASMLFYNDKFRVEAWFNVKTGGEIVFKWNE